MKILVLQLKRIGDLILTTPALAAIRAAIPHSHITLVTSGSNSQIAPGIDTVNDVMLYRAGQPNGAFWGRLAFSSFDACLDFTGTDRSALISLLSKGEVRAAFERVRSSRYRSVFYNRYITSSVRERHTVDHYLDLLAALDIVPKEAPPVRLAVPARCEEIAREKLSALGVDGPFAIVHPGTARREKYWAPERWSDVIQHIESRHGLPVLLTGGNDLFERAHMDAVVRLLGTPERNLCGQLDLLTLGALAAQARIFLSVDSGPMHLASAFGTPQVAIFGKTNPFHWRPRHDRALILLNDRVLEEFAPRHEPAAVTATSTDAVRHATDTLLGRSGP